MFKESEIYTFKLYFQYHCAAIAITLPRNELLNNDLVYKQNTIKKKHQFSTKNNNLYITIVLKTLMKIN